MLQDITRRLRQDERGLSNVIVIVLSLVLVVIVVANVVLWSYQMNQHDWEKIQENVKIVDVEPITRSPWASATEEYAVNVGNLIGGSYTDTVAVDENHETFNEGLASLEYGYAFKSSSERVSTSSATPVVDDEAELNITLEGDAHVFIIYNAGNDKGSEEDVAGKSCAISVDGDDKAFSWQSPYARDSANSVTVIWAAYLSEGDHTIQGRFCVNRPGDTVGIDTRQILAFWSPEVVATYTRSTVAVTTTSTMPVDDTEANLNFTLNEESVVLIIYNAGNQRGSDEPQEGKGITLNIDESDMSTRQWQSGYGFQDANSVTIVYSAILLPGNHTVRGRFFSNSGQRTTIDERQLIAFCFPKEIATHSFTESTASASTASGSPVNDTEATLTEEVPTQANCLIVYTAGNTHSTTECREGKGTLIRIDGSDRRNSSSWQSPQSRDYANSVTSVWSETLNSGSHSFQGRFRSNDPNSSSPSVTISHRQFLLLAIPVSQDEYRLDLNNTFALDLPTYPLGSILTVEIQLRYRVNSSSEKWFIEALNISSSTYSDHGFNTTAGHTPTADWDYYTVSLTDQWNDYVSQDGYINVKIVDEGLDSNQTAIEVDFLAIRVSIVGVMFTFQNSGPLTSHLVALWINNSTDHRRYDIDTFVSAGETITHTWSGMSVPSEPYLVKIVTERGNIGISTKP